MFLIVEYHHLGNDRARVAWLSATFCKWFMQALISVLSSFDGLSKLT